MKVWELVIIMAVITLMVGAGCYSAGYATGQRDYITQNCMAYPFLLVDPSKYWACQRLPQP